MAQAVSSFSHRISFRRDVCLDRPLYISTTTTSPSPSLLPHSSTSRHIPFTMAAPSARNGVPPDAQAKLNGLVAADAAKTRVHTFDPNASPQEKAAAAGKGREQLKRVGHSNGGAQPTGEPHSIATISMRHPSA